MSFGMTFNDGSIFIKLVGIVQSVDVYAQFATETLPYFVIK
jgi:hypothetical protein